MYLEAKNLGFTGTSSDYIQTKDYIQLVKTHQKKEEKVMRERVVDQRYIYKETTSIREYEHDWLKVLRNQVQDREKTEYRIRVEQKELEMAKAVSNL